MRLQAGELLMRKAPRGLRESVLSLLAPVTQEVALCFVAEQALGLPKLY